MQENWGLIFSTLLTVEILVFSMVASIYSNTLRYAETADVNMYSSVTQADLCLGRDPDAQMASQKIAKEWLIAAELYRRQIRTRAYSSIWCGIGIILFFIALGFAIIACGIVSWVLSSASFLFLVCAVITHIFNLNFSFLDELISRIQTISPVSRIWVIFPNPPRWPDIQKCIDDHDWLKSYLLYVEKEIAQHRNPKQE